MLVDNDPANRVMAISTIAFFGAGAVIGLLHLFPIFQTGRTRDFIFAFCSATIALGCGLIAPMINAGGDVGGSYIAWAGAAFFGLGAVAIAWQAVR